MNYNELRNELTSLKDEFILNPTKELYDKIVIVYKKLIELDRQLQMFNTPRRNYGDKKEN